jgi:tetratricopeptide (TPR) repeat protein
MEAAQRYGQLRIYPRALFLLGEAERLRPKDPAVWRAKGEVYLATGEYDRCIEVLERGQELKPDDLELRLMRVDIDAILGWSMDSRVRIRELLALYPNEPRVHLMAALLARQIADAKGAQEHLRTALRLDPKNDRVYGLLSGLEWEVGQRKEALEHIQKALELNSHSLDYLLHLAEIQRFGAAPGAPAWKAAEQTYRRALLVNPSSVQARFGVALCRLRQGREDAVELLEQIVRQHPFSPAPLLELGNIYNRMGRREEGAKLLARYNEGIRENDELKGLSLRMAMQAENPASYIDMGAMFVRTGQPQKAVVVLRRAVRMKPSSARARELLVTALRQAGRDPEIPGILARP